MENCLFTSFGKIKVRHGNPLFTRLLKQIKRYSFHNHNYTARGDFGHDTDCSHAEQQRTDPPAGRRNLLYESFSAGTMVDGSPRAASKSNIDLGLAPKINHRSGPT